MALTKVNSSGIKDGEIVNADINASAAIAKSKLASLDIANADVNSSAAIAGSKISPDFGSQNVTTTGNLSVGSASTDHLIHAKNSSTSATKIVVESTGTNSYPAFRIVNDARSYDFGIDGATDNLRIYDVTGTAERLVVNSDGHIDITGNLDVGAGIDVTGAISASTTISDSKGNVRSIPRENKSSAYTLVAGDAGVVIYISTGGVTIPASVMSQADAVTIINDSGSDQTLTQGSGLTLYNTADAATGNRTLAGRGMATIYFASATTAYISGAGLS